MLPYSAEALFASYGQYNLAIWPIQLLFLVLAPLVLVRSRWLPLLLVIPAGWLVISGWSGGLLGIWQVAASAGAGLAVLLLLFRRLLRPSLLVLAVGLFPYGAVSATEGGGSVYPYGLNTVAAGVLPPAGHYLYLYNLYFTADRVVDGAGNSAVPDFQLDVRAHTLRYLGVLDAQVLGGRPAVLLAQPFIDGDLEVGSRGDGRSGLGDTTTGIMVGWQRPGWHSIAGLDLTLPTGAYSETRAFNPGRNHFAGTFYYAVTRPFGERYDANLRVNLTLNARNPDTRYQSGVESGGDYSLNRRFGANWLAGVNGYFQYQLTDDKRDGVTVGEDGNRVRVFAIGPQVAYRGDGWGVVAKWQRETGARNKAEGDKYWLQLFWRL